MKGPCIILSLAELRDAALAESPPRDTPPLASLTLGHVSKGILSVSEASEALMIAVMDTGATPDTPRLMLLKAPYSEDGLVINPRRFKIDAPGL